MRPLFFRPLTAGLAALLLTAPALQAEMTDAERESFRAEIRAYLLENPEVLMEAIGVLEDRRATEAVANDVALVDSNSAEIFTDPASWSGGNPDGDVTVVEFVDYRCGYCRRAHDEVTELVASDGNIRLVFKEFPILGEASELSSRFAISVLQLEGADHYKTVHDALIAHQGDVTPEALNQIGTDAGLGDVAAVMEHMTSDDVTGVIAANHALGQRLGINGTPTFVVDSTMLRGYVPLDAMRQVVEEERAG
ncbi:DsbA family protein [Szabonella alba]|uniref:Thioredoxin domain-containing protein n=1 Tax=Szabonella alba TaxID=2804194 RepID=A0A8K0VDT0_9RHOB|nr:DsbA family protein [Szabonella alba]MBL4917849.1 thioredoxin domain-containing protein [Szabonella alba]